MKKRIFSVLLCLCMVLALFPVTAFAAVGQYTVTYAYDAVNENCEKVFDIKNHGEGLNLRGKTFTKEDQVQIGWWSQENGFTTYDFGDLYTADADVTLYPVWDEIITMEVPFTTTVKRDGNVPPGETTFTLEVLDCRGTKLEPDGVTISGTVNTTGVGDYDGTLTITGPSQWVYSMFDGYFIFVQQVNEGKSYWTYDDTVWAVRLPIIEMALGDDEEGADPDDSASLLIFPTTTVKVEGADSEIYEIYDADYSEGHVEQMSFTNTYTRSIIILPPPIQTEPEPTEPELTEPEPTEPAEPEETPIPTEPEEPTESIQENVASDDVPKTGDDSNMILWITLLLASGFGAAGAVVYGKRKKYVK